MADKKFPLRFMTAVPVNADLSLVAPKFMVWLLNDVKKYAATDGQKAIATVVNLYKRIIDGGAVTDDEWRAAAYIATHTARVAADEAERAAALTAAYAAELALTAAYAAERAAEAATESAAEAATYASAARAAEDAETYTAATYAAAEDEALAAADAAYKKMSNKLIELLKKAPVVEGGYGTGN